MLKQVSYQNAILKYEVKGDGPAVVLLHGFGEKKEIWNQQIPELSQYKLIIPDLPGSGHSEIIPDMTMEGLAGSIVAILDNENNASCVMIGHSMGGYITLAFAEQYPERLNGIGLFHSTAFADNEEKKDTRRKGIQFIKEHGAFAFLKTMIPNLYSQETKDHQPQLVQNHIQSATDFKEAALISYYESMMQRPDRSDLLRQTELPVMLILGVSDNAVPLQDGLKQSTYPKITFINVLERAGHMGMTEMPSESNEHLDQYISYIYQS